MRYVIAGRQDELKQAQHQVQVAAETLAAISSGNATLPRRDGMYLAPELIGEGYSNYSFDTGLPFAVSRNMRLVYQLGATPNKEDASAAWRDHGSQLTTDLQSVARDRQNELATVQALATHPDNPIGYLTVTGLARAAVHIFLLLLMNAAMLALGRTVRTRRRPWQLATA
jgi:hypothetical protein